MRRRCSGCVQPVCVAYGLVKENLVQQCGVRGAVGVERRVAGRIQQGDVRVAAVGGCEVEALKELRVF